MKTKIPNVKGPMPTILACIASIGVIGTAFSASKATLKAEKLLKSSEYMEKSGKERMKTVVSLYVPTICIGIGTIACIFGANAVNKKRQTCILGAFTLADQMYKKYREKARDIYGEDADFKIRSAMAEEGEADAAEIEDVRCMFFDEYSNRYFWRTMKEILDAEYLLNRALALRGYASLNEFYDYLCLPPTEMGEELGWSSYELGEFYGYSWIEFQHYLCEEPADPDVPSYYMIYMPFSPHKGYLDY